MGIIKKQKNKFLKKHPNKNESLSCLLISPRHLYLRSLNVRKIPRSHELPLKDPSWLLWPKLKPPSKMEVQWMPSPESLMNTNKTSELNNSPTTNSMKDKPLNVTMNSNSEPVKSKKLKPLLKKPTKPYLVANNNKSEPKKT